MSSQVMRFSSHGVGFSELPIEMNAVCPFLKKLLTGFYKNLDPSYSQIIDQKTLGGCKLIRCGAPDHYVLAFSGNNDTTFHLHEKLKNYLNTNKISHDDQERCVSPIKKPAQRTL